jgi:ABC-2 type transport system ATP-binding protein
MGVAMPPTGSADRGVSAQGLGKRYGDLWALRGLDLDVAPGSVLGLLGHNGAGKTTAIRILTTLTSATEGRASVAGFDVAEHPAAIRQRIGVAAQQATVDGLLTARLNLEMVGRLHHLSKRAARQRADALLEQLDLTDAASRLVKTFPAACAGGWTSRPASWPSPRCCSSTSPPPGWIRAAAATCGTCCADWSGTARRSS